MINSISRHASTQHNGHELLVTLAMLTLPTLGILCLALLSL